MIHQTLKYLCGPVLLFAVMAFPAVSLAQSAATDITDDVYADLAALLDMYLIEKRTPEGGLVSAFDYERALQSADTLQRVTRQKNTLRDFDIAQLVSRERATAFWINAYNFFMLAYILEEKPDGELVESVWDYGGRYNPFRDSVFTRQAFEVGGQLYSLDNIEKDTLLGSEYKDRGWFDAKVHFAVNCAAVSCPPLRIEVYRASRIDEQLAENTRLAFNTPRHLRVEGSTLYLSSLFDWYAQDFTRQSEEALDFIKNYASDEVSATLNENLRIDYIEYDWRLNRPANFPEFDNRP